MNIENLSTLKIHKLTQEQYDRALAEGNIDPNAIYLTPESSVNGVSPHIGENGNWWIGDEDTGVAATAGAEVAEAAAERAESQALTAKNHAEDAAASASDASGYATSASRASSNASSYAEDANDAASSAQTYAGNASTSAASANTAKTNAETAATNAANSASSASSSASSASSSASTATTQANNAKSSASSAATSASQASSSASEAGTAANTAKGYRDEVKNMLDNAVIDPSEAVLVTSQNLTDTQMVTARENIGAASQADLEALNNEKVELENKVDALPNNATLIGNVAEVVKEEVPLVKTAEQPTFVNSIDEMTDTSKVYLMSDGFLYARMTTKGKKVTPLTSEDFVACNVNTDGTLNTVSSSKIRIATTELLPLTGDLLCINCPSPYQYIVYFYSGNSTSNYIGKTSFKSGGITDMLKETVSSGTIAGAKYCRISLRDSTNSNAILTDRVNEFLSAVSVEYVSAEEAEVSAWQSTGLTYNQPSVYEDRIAALENALEGLEYGTY